MPRAAKADEPTRLSPVRRVKLLERVAAFYHQRFLDGPEGQQHLVRVHGIRNVAVFRDYRIGYADGSLLKALPQDADGLRLFRQLGILDGRRQEVLAGCVVFPLFDAAGAVVGLYGLPIEEGVTAPVQVGEATRGLWNAQAARRASQLLVTGSLLDALTLIDRGLADVVPCLGPEGLNEDHRALFGQCALRGVTLCLPGGASTERLEQQFAALQLPVASARIAASGSGCLVPRRLPRPRPNAWLL